MVTFSGGVAKLIMLYVFSFFESIKPNSFYMVLCVILFFKQNIYYGKCNVMRFHAYGFPNQLKAFTCKTLFSYLSAV